MTYPTPLHALLCCTQTTLSDSLVFTENTTAILAGDSSVTSGDDVVLTCTGTGYPQVTVDWETSGLSEFSSVSVGDETIVSTATPETPFIVTKTISLRSVTVRDCGEVTCTAHTIVSMVQNTTNIEVDGEYCEVLYWRLAMKATCTYVVCCVGDFKGKAVHTFVMCAHFPDVRTLHSMLHCCCIVDD